jgi:hypothetical protein
MRGGHHIHNAGTLILSCNLQAAYVFLEYVLYDSTYLISV